jgi:hypothetical protein
MISPKLLADVVRHKETFYPSAWARYNLAKPGSIRFMPREDRMAALEHGKGRSVGFFAPAPSVAIPLKITGAIPRVRPQTQGDFDAKKIQCFRRMRLSRRVLVRD